MKILLVSACIAAATLGISSSASAQYQYPPAQGQYGYPPAQGQYGYPPAQGQYGYPPAQGQYGYPPAQGQYGYPPAQGQYGYPPAQGQYGYPPAQGQYEYPSPEGQYGYPPETAYDQAAPPGSVWVGGPGECLYSGGAVYWCAPGVVFTGFPAGWDYARYPVASIAPGIAVDPIWFEGWRQSRPGFVFRGRLATGAERRTFLEHRQDIIRNGARNPRERERRLEERRPER